MSKGRDDLYRCYASKSEYFAILIRGSISIYMDAEYSPFYIRIFQTKSHLVKRGFPSDSAKKGLELSH